MGSGYVQVPVDSTGKKIDCLSLTAGGTTIYRQAVVIADPTSSSGYATVTGGAVKVTGQLSLGPSTNNIGAVSLAAGTANIGFLNNISATVIVAGVVSLGAGTNLIGAVSNAAGTALMGAVSLAAGTANIGFINNISATVIVAGVVSLGAGTNLIGAVSNAAGTALMGAVSLAAGTANIGFINNISATVTVVNSGFFDSSAGSTTLVRVGDSANSAVRVNIVAGGTGGGLVSITGTATVVIGTGTNNIGTVGISSGTLAMSGMLDGISATVTVAGNVNLSATAIVAFTSQVTFAASLTAGSTATLMGLQGKISAGANSSATFAWADVQGRQIVMLNHPSLVPSASHGPKTVALPTSAAVALVAAPGANLSIYVTGIVATNIHATQGTDFIVYDGANSASAVIATFLAPFSSPGASVFQFQYNPPWKVSANTALNAQMLAAAYMTIHIHFYVGS